MKTSPPNLTRQQSLALASIAVVASLGVVWLMAFVVWNDSSPASTTQTTTPTSTDSTTSVPDTTVTTTSTTGPDPSTTIGVFDEVAAVEAFVEEFSRAVEAGDSEFLFERLHPAVKATYEEEVCRRHIVDRILVYENYRQVGPIVGPFDSEFGEFPITSYEAGVAFESDDVSMETTAVFSLTEGVVRWFAECS